jgi:hypothetical protein
MSDQLARHKEDLSAKQAQLNLLQWIYGIYDETLLATSRQQLLTNIHEHMSDLKDLISKFEKANTNYSTLENEILKQLITKESDTSPESKAQLFKEAVQLRRQVYWTRVEQVGTKNPCLIDVKLKRITPLCSSVINFESMRFHTTQTEHLQSQNLILVANYESSLLELQTFTEANRSAENLVQYVPSQRASYEEDITLLEQQLSELAISATPAETKVNTVIT